MSADAFARPDRLLPPVTLDGNLDAYTVAPQKKFTELAGYAKHHSAPGLAEFRSRVLDEILGAAREKQLPRVWLSNRPPLRLAEFANDRPPGPAQKIIPAAATIRSDFLEPLLQALKALHDRGCTLPFLSGPTSLPPLSPTTTPPSDVLPYLGRTLDLASNIALIHPTTDTLLLAKQQHDAGPFEIATRVVNSAAIAIEAGDFEAVQCTSMLCTTVAVKQAKLLAIEPYLASAGFHPASPVPMPLTLACTSWARLSNVSGLVRDVTTLGDELSLLYGWKDIGGSVLSDMLDWVWNGSRFVQR